MASKNEGGPFNTTSKTEVPNHGWGHGVKRGPSDLQTMRSGCYQAEKLKTTRGFVTPIDLEECGDRHQFGWRTRENFL